MKLYDLLDKDLLRQHQETRRVGVQRHPTLPLRIYNYGPAAQFDPHWGDGCIDYCRGLIVDENDEIIARPFKKFHNLNTQSIPETMEENLPPAAPKITKKLDGSMGILWSYDGHEGIATRGSFTSPQSQWATAYYNKRKQSYTKWVVGSTPIFEIIYAENRIVVDYPQDDLILIGMIEIETGYEASPQFLGIEAHRNFFKSVDEIFYKSLSDLKNADIENEEGYVLTYDLGNRPPLKVKIKMADYVRLHRIITGMNARSVWELMRDGKDLSTFDNTPPHFKKWLNSWVEKLGKESFDIYQDAKRFYLDRPVFDDIDARRYRAEFAAYLKRDVPQNLHGILFSMLDGKDVNPVIWRMLEPRGDDRSFRTEGE